MPVEVPYTTKPEDVTKLLLLLPSTEVPKGKVEASFFKSLGFSLSSGNYLPAIMRELGFLDKNDNPSATWLAYAADEKRGRILASGITKTYGDLFSEVLCPYLEDDEVLLDYLKRSVKASPKTLELMLQTFRNLSELADFQDILCPEGPGEPAVETQDMANVKVNPNLQVNIQVHIDPNTPDDKIETIFKNMRKYLLGKE